MQNDTSAGRVNIDRKWLRLSLWLWSLCVACAVSSRNNLVGSSQLSHQGVSAVVVKVDSANISIIEGTCSTCSLVVATAAGAIECAAARVGVWTAATSTGECRSLELLLLTLTLESLEQAGSGLGGKLIVAKTNTNWATGKIKTVHLLKCLTGLMRITESVTCQLLCIFGLLDWALTAQSRNLCCVPAPPFATAQTRAHQTVQRHSVNQSQ